ncbi:MAG TPA: PilZ domain-containing protein [Nitrospiraceae bacterium]|nr:PilZ domain-containing protein [Nitrospiraceae bacterium]
MDQRHKAFVHTPITRNSFEVRSRTRTVVFMHSKTSSNPPTLSSSPRETRKEERKCRRVPVAFTSLFSADGPEWSGTAINLSREGCAIRSTTPVQKGDYLHVLIFPGPNQTPIEVGVARVRWAANEQCGVEFMTLAPRDATRLQDLLTLIGA